MRKVSYILIQKSVGLKMCFPSTYLNPLQINRVHNGTLEEFYSCEMSLEETFQFKVRWLPAHCNVLPQNYNIDISLRGPNNLKLHIY